MRIYTKIVFDISTGELLHEEYHEYAGEVAQCKSGGGGGNTGAASYPDYTDYASMVLFGFMTGDLDNPADIEPLPWPSLSSGILFDLKDALDGPSPYSFAEDFDPSGQMLLVEDRYDVLANAVDNMDIAEDWPNLIDLAKSKRDDVFEGVDLTDVVEDYSARQLPSLQRSAARFVGGMADINGVNSSAFVMGLAQLERDYGRDVGSYHAKLALYQDTAKADFVRESVRDLVNMTFAHKELLHRLTDSRAGVSRLQIMAERDRIDRDLDLSVNDAVWDLQLYQHAGNLIAAAPGGVVHQTAPTTSTAARVMGGVMSGISVGAGATQGTGWWQLAGGAVGGIAGGLLGYYS